jgi:RHS repeat-associated protein
VDNITHSLDTISYLTGNGNTEDGLYFYHGNHLSSTQFITDINANISQAVLYTPWGSVIKEYKADWMLDTIPRYLFNGKELDEESGMYYYSARYYAPPSFISRDPLFEKFPTFSPYAYTFNNPIRYIDPDGRNPILAEDGTFLGTTTNQKTGEAEWKGVPIVMNRDDYNNMTEGKEKGISQTDALNKGTQLNEYGKGISISNDTWSHIENNGGDNRLTPYVQNQSNSTVYYKPEGKIGDVDMNPGYSASGAYPIAPNTDLYVQVDGVATRKYSDNVLKIPTGSRIRITSEGGGMISGKGGNAIRIHGEYGWVDTKWQAKQQKKGDTSWDNLFKKAAQIGIRKY